MLRVLLCSRSFRPYPLVGVNLAPKATRAPPQRSIIEEKDDEQASARLQNFIPAEHTLTIASFFYICFCFVLFLLNSCFCFC